MKRYAIIVAGGSGLRMNSDVPKQFLPLAGLPVLAHTLRRFHSTGDLEILLVLPEAQIDTWNVLAVAKGIDIPCRILPGGSTRFHSVRQGLTAVSDPDSVVAIHDGVRPFVSANLIEACFKAASSHGSAVAAIALKDSIRQLDGEGQSHPVDRNRFRLVQTPQTFRADWLKQAYAIEYQPSFTDCASVVEQAGFPIHLVEGEYLNFKITTSEDLELAEALIHRLDGF